MNHPTILSIITPTRGNFSDFWLQSLLAIKGSVEFVLVYPPGTAQRGLDDSRFKIITSPYKGEVIQRAIGLLNASGQYSIALDDDDFLHPDVVILVEKYFSAYPQSWCLNLGKKNIPFQNEEDITAAWNLLPHVDQLTVIPPSPKPSLRRQSHADHEILEEVPIAPLENKFKWRSLWYKTQRTDQDGAHRENFNNRVWQTSLVQESLGDLLAKTQFFRHLVWMPFWSLDRLLGLFLQAKYYQKDLIIGHRIWAPEQVRYIIMPSTLKGERRAIFPADMILALRFPQYGYFWNLFWDQWWRSFSIWIHSLFQQKKK